MQKGFIYQSGSGKTKKFYVRYRTGWTVNSQGKKMPQFESEFLCDFSDALYYSPKAKAVKDRCKEVMDRVNKGMAAPRPGSDRKIVDFMAEYLDHIGAISPRSGRPVLKASSQEQYRHAWKLHLQAHIGDKTLREYQARDLSRLLLAKSDPNGEDLNITTLRFLRAIMSSMFTRAVEMELLDHNPVHDVVMPSSARGAKTSPHYSPEEAHRAIDALEGRPDLQLILALSCFNALRPGEIPCLRVDDFKMDSAGNRWVFVTRGYTRQKLDVPKTEGSAARIPVMDETVPFLDAWAVAYVMKWPGDTGAGWLFPNGGVLQSKNIIAPEMKIYAGKRSCINLGQVIAREIRPLLKAAGVPWKMLKAGRSGAITSLGDQNKLKFAQALARHSDFSTTADIYNKRMSDEEMLRQMAEMRKRLGPA